MVNQIRTLLLNRGNDGYGPDFPGEEYIDPAFVPRAVTGALITANRLLFGASPDRVFQNYRLRQAMTLIHATELEEFVYLADKRITYWPLSDSALFNQTFRTGVQQLTGVQADLFLRGDHDANDGAGWSQQTWRLVLLDAETVQIQTYRPRLTTTIVNYSTGSGYLSSPIPLPNTQLLATFQQPETGLASWQIDSCARPDLDIGQALQQIETALGTAGTSELFNDPRPFFATLAEVYTQHRFQTYRWAALLLGMAYRTETFPQIPGGAR